MVAKFRVVITDHRFPNVDAERQVLSEIGAELVVGQVKSEDEIIELTRNAHGILNARAIISTKAIESLECCRVVVRYGIGVDTIDIPAATKKGIMVCNVPDYCIEEVSDHALALILCLARKVVFSARQVLLGEWAVTNLRPIKRISVQTVGIVGFGRIGRELAQKAMRLGFRVIAYDPYVGVENTSEEGVEFVSFKKLLMNADFVTLHTPLTFNTIGMIGEEQIALMKPTAYLVNVSRGPLVDEAALVRALHEKRIAGAGLDVLMKEPPAPDNPLFKMDNVIITPHAAWFSDEAVEELQRKAAQRVAAVLTGRIPEAIVNPEVKNQQRGDLKP